MHYRLESSNGGVQMQSPQRGFIRPQLSRFGNRKRNEILWVFTVDYATTITNVVTVEHAEFNVALCWPSSSGCERLFMSDWKTAIKQQSRPIRRSGTKISFIFSQSPIIGIQTHSISVWRWHTFVSDHEGMDSSGTKREQNHTKHRH